jgi:hypothetical protein
MVRYFFLIAVVGLVGCGKRYPPVANSGNPPLNPQINEKDVVIRASSSLPVKVNHRGGKKIFDASANQPVTVTNAAAVTMTLDNSNFTAPTITNDLLDFGYLALSALRDNSLRVCGPSGNTKCTKAFIRVYTTGVAGEGLYNAADGYGAPMTSSLTTPLSVGLGAANAAVMQSITIANSKRIVRLNDFTPTPNYNVKFDFTEAGAGDYSTTIVVEYGLSL